jgi:phospholipase C
LLQPRSGSAYGVSSDEWRYNTVDLFHVTAMKKRSILAWILFAACTVTLVRAQRSTATLIDLQHIIVIFQENWSFDALYGHFPGANGIANAGNAIRQVDRSGRRYNSLPQPMDTRKSPPVPDPRFPADLPVAVSLASCKDFRVMPRIR